MTIEIKELIIRATVGKTSEDAKGGNTGDGPVDEEKIVRSCVEQVMEILKREKER